MALLFSHQSMLHSEYKVEDIYTNIGVFEAILLVEQDFIPQLFFAAWTLEIIGIF